MPGTVITLVSPEGVPLADALIESMARKIRDISGDSVRIDTLEAGRAVDMLSPVEGPPPFMDRLRQALSTHASLDVFVQPATDRRRKKLLVSDMDATMIEGEILDDLAAHLGLHDKIAPITARAMNGELDFAEALKLRIALLRGMPIAKLIELTEKVKPSKGAAVLLRTLKRHGVRCVLVSGGFDTVSQSVAARLGFDRHVANRLLLAEDHSLTGEVSMPIVDREVKKSTLLDECRVMGIDPGLSMAVGDGANDIPMLQAAGIGFGYFGKPAVQAATPYQIRHTDLTAILYMQGYKKEEISA